MHFTAMCMKLHAVDGHIILGPTHEHMANACTDAAHSHDTLASTSHDAAYFALGASGCGSGEYVAGYHSCHPHQPQTTGCPGAAGPASSTSSTIQLHDVLEHSHTHTDERGQRQCGCAALPGSQAAPGRDTSTTHLGRSCATLRQIDSPAMADAHFSVTPREADRHSPGVPRVGSRGTCQPPPPGAHPALCAQREPACMPASHRGPKAARSPAATGSAQHQWLKLARPHIGNAHLDPGTSSRSAGRARRISCPGGLPSRT